MTCSSLSGHSIRQKKLLLFLTSPLPWTPQRQRSFLFYLHHPILYNSDVCTYVIQLYVSGAHYPVSNLRYYIIQFPPFHHITVLLSPVVPPYEINRQQILSRSHGWNHLRLDGSVLAEKRQSLVQHFNRQRKRQRYRKRVCGGK